MVPEDDKKDDNRRRFLGFSAAPGNGIVLRPAPLYGQEREMAQKNPSAEAASATEDLMREHGILHRVLLVHEQGLRRLAGKRVGIRDDLAPIVQRSPQGASGGAAATEGPLGQPSARWSENCAAL